MKRKIIIEQKKIEPNFRELSYNTIPSTNDFLRGKRRKQVVTDLLDVVISSKEEKEGGGDKKIISLFNLNTYALSGGGSWELNNSTSHYPIIGDEGGNYTFRFLINDSPNCELNNQVDRTWFHEFPSSMLLIEGDDDKVVIDDDMNHSRDHDDTRYTQYSYTMNPEKLGGDDSTGIEIGSLQAGIMITGATYVLKPKIIGYTSRNDGSGIERMHVKVDGKFMMEATPCSKDELGITPIIPFLENDGECVMMSQLDINWLHEDCKEWIKLCPGQHKLEVSFTTNHELDHFNSYYELQLLFEESTIFLKKTEPDK